MSIRRKTALVIGVMVVFLITSLYAVSSRILLQAFAAVEERQAPQNVERVLAALSNALDKQSTTTADWAGWDDTYRFIADGNQDYYRTNLGDASIADLSINLLLYVQPTGRIVFGTGFDLNKQKKTPLPTGIHEHIRPNSFLLQHPATESLKAGILMLPSGPVMVSSRPILTSQKTGPIRGTLIMGRNLDPQEFQRFALLTHLKLTVHRAGEKTLPADFLEVWSRLQSGERHVIRPLNEDVLGAYALLKDIFGAPALLLRVDVSRTTYHQGLASLQYLIVALTIACLVMGGVMLLLLERLVICRLSALSDEVTDISATGDISRRLHADGNDELATLALNVNNLLRTTEQSQHKLLESENRFKTFMEHSPAVAYMKDEEGRYLYVNSTYEARFQTSREKVIGKNDFEIRPQEIAQTLRHNDRTVLQSGKALQVEEEVRMPDGNMSNWLSIKFPFHEASGRRVLAGMSIDITERKAVDKMKNEFVSIVSHELRTPLTSIRGSLGLVAGGVAGELPARAKHMIDIAQKNSERLIRLINDILDIEKIESGKIKLDSRPHDLMPLVTSAIEANKGYGQDLGVEFELKAQIPDACVMADGDRVVQVLTNLLSNAAKFSPRGEKVLIEVMRLGSKFRVEITNRGSSIPEEFRSHLFQKFAQVDSSDTRQKGGTGLGLAISKAIIESLGGTIDFQSDEARGTTFFFELPEYLPAEAVADQSGEHSRTILCVEDDTDVLLVVRELLQGLADVIHAPTIVEARSLLNQENFDLVMLELELPDGSGTELLPLIKAHVPHVPLVVFSASEVDQEIADQVDAAFVKSRTLDHQLRKVIQSLLEAVPRTPEASSAPFPVAR